MRVFAVAIYPRAMLLGVVPSCGYGEDITARNVFAIAGKRLIYAELERLSQRDFTTVQSTEDGPLSNSELPSHGSS
jgi:hypothetical protein